MPVGAAPPARRPWRRLWVRLSLAIALVTAAGVAGAGLATYRAAGSGFRHFVAHTEALGLDEASGPGAALVARLASHYRSAGSWTDVEAVFDASPGRGPGPAMRGAGPGVRWATYLVADADGRIVYDGPDGTAVGRALDATERSAALAVRDGDVVVGYVLARPPSATRLPAAAQSFLDLLTGALWRAGLAAALAGLALGVLIARGMTAPLDRLAAAARGIARGERGERLRVEGVEEVAAVAAAFNEMADHLERSESLRRQMVADIAHELRTPLAVIQGNLRAILDGVYPLDLGEVATIHEETRVLVGLVEDLRDLARAEAGRLELDPRPVAVADALGRAAERFAEPARSAGVTLSTGPVNGMPVVVADSDRLDQVMANLLSNAIRHTPPEGTVTLSAAEEKTCVRLTIADTGAGISPEDLPHVFERFWRADAARTRAQGGSGLGLAIARQLVEAMGGTIDAESVPGDGSRFHVRLPSAVVADATSATR